MKLIVDIPEDVYTRLFDNGIQDNEIAVDDVCEMARALRLGTPLDDLRAEIEEVRLDVHTELVKQEYRSFYLSGAYGALIRVLKIIEKHTSGKKPQESEDKE